MNQQELIASLQGNATPNNGRTAFCPDEDQIAAYVDGSLESRDHEKLQRHLAECRICVARVGHLSRLIREAGDAVQPAEALLAHAREMIHRRSTRAAPKWAAAAAIALAVLILPSLIPDTEEGMEPVAPTTRTVPSVISTPDLQSPSSGMSIALDQLVFSWQAVPESLYYNVRIVSHSGLLITEQRVAGTQWQAPEDLNLTPGAEYYVRVDAFLSGARSISSDHVRFKVAKQ